MIAKKYQQFISEYSEHIPELKSTKCVSLVCGCAVFVLKSNKVLAFKNYFNDNLSEFVPIIYKNLEECKIAFDALAREYRKNKWEKIVGQLKGKESLNPIGTMQLFKFEDDWWKAMNCFDYCGWMPHCELTQMAIPDGLFPFIFRTGEIYHSRDYTRESIKKPQNILITDMKDSEDEFHNPLMKIKILSDEEAATYEKIKENIRNGIRKDKELFLTPIQARALFFDVDENKCVKLKCNQKGRTYSYIPITEVETENMYENFKRRLNHVMYSKEGYGLTFFLNNRNRGDSAEITLEECLTEIFCFNKALPSYEPEGYSELFKQKIAKPFIEESGFYKNLTQKLSIEKIVGFCRNIDITTN